MSFFGFWGVGFSGGVEGGGLGAGFGKIVPFKEEYGSLEILGGWEEDCGVCKESDVGSFFLRRRRVWTVSLVSTCSFEHVMGGFQDTSCFFPP